MLPYGRQSIDDDDIAAVVEALRSALLTTGPTVADFEAALAQATGAPFVATVSSGTAALHAAYRAVGIGPDDEVVVPALTFAATANAALYLGARPVFADVDRETGTLDPESAERVITHRTRAIVAVDYAGHPADYDALRDIASRRGLVLVDDAAHSLGATDRGRRIGELADVATLSFHPVKHITTGEGGAVLSRDPDVHRKAVEFRSHGIVREQVRLRRQEGSWYNEMQDLGFNYRLTDVQSALGISQLRKLPQFLERRRQIAAKYDRELSGLEAFRIPGRRDGVEPAWHLYVLRIDGDPAFRAQRRRVAFDALRERGLGVQVHYLPVYLHPYYQDMGYGPGLCPVAEEFYSQAISIPIFPAMTDPEADYVVEAVRDVARDLD
ncbi:MAG: UDP-4-amino-4,6-dideoxy-N-acetyl-beta-L-altrosamine transaminase [Candidatus Limnocylindrales bacterium]